MNELSVLLVGFGQLGQPLGALLAANGHRVAALQRSRSGHEQGVELIQADLSQAEGWPPLPAAEVVVVCLSPGGFSEEHYQRIFVHGLNHLVPRLHRDGLKRLLFVSSTSVYQQDDDSWVDETSPTQPQGFSGQTLLQAEQNLAAHGLPLTVVRFSGIYGAHRLGLFHRMVQGEVATEGPSHYTNRIHQDDAVGVLAHLTENALADAPLEPLYLASDHEPARQHEVAAWVRQALQLPPVSRAEAPSSKRRAGSKRCRNTRLLEAGYRFRFPGFREGYAAAVAANRLSSAP